MGQAHLIAQIKIGSKITSGYIDIIYIISSILASFYCTCYLQPISSNCLLHPASCPQPKKHKSENIINLKSTRFQQKTTQI